MASQMSQSRSTEDLCVRSAVDLAATGDARAIREIIKLQPLIALEDKSADEKPVVNVFRWATPEELKE